MKTSPQLSAEHLSYFYGGRQILSDVSIAMYPEEITTIIGPNGSGKTTLAKVLLGLLKPTNGQLKHAPGLRIGYVPQSFHISPILPLTVAGLLDFGIASTPEEREQLIAEMGIQHILDTPIQAVSGGELQRILLARALLGSPQLLILDEPTQGLDIKGQVEFYHRVERLKRERKLSILLISHDLHFVMRATDKVICLHHHICCAGTPADVSKHPNYIQLFGQDAAETLAIYPHHHDHVH